MPLWDKAKQATVKQAANRRLAYFHVFKEAEPGLPDTYHVPTSILKELLSQPRIDELNGNCDPVKVGTLRDLTDEFMVDLSRQVLREIYPRYPNHDFEVSIESRLDHDPPARLLLIHVTSK
ncbi:MAG: hypothetical protein WD271_15955 [Acidimicrobiia bacterium]